MATCGLKTPLLPIGSVGSCPPISFSYVTAPVADQRAKRDGQRFLKHPFAYTRQGSSEGELGFVHI